MLSFVPRAVEQKIYFKVKIESGTKGEEKGMPNCSQLNYKYDGVGKCSIWKCPCHLSNSWGGGVFLFVLLFLFLTFFEGERERVPASNVG